MSGQSRDRVDAYDMIGALGAAAPDASPRVGYPPGALLLLSLLLLLLLLV